MKISTILSTLIKIGLVIIAIPLLFEWYNQDGKLMRITPIGLTQKKLDIQPQDGKMNVLDKDGKVIQWGWGIDLEDKFYMNYEEAKTPWLPKSLSYLKYRQWFFVLIYMPDHIIQIPLAIFNPFCGASIQIYDRKVGKDIINSRKIQESSLTSCPGLDPHSAAIGQGIHHKDGDFIISYTLQENRDYRVDLNAPKISFKGTFFLKDKMSESQFVIRSFTNEFDLYYISTKKSAIPVLGEYTYEGKNYKCGDKECIGVYDNGRGHFTYHTNWVWSHLVTYLPSGKTFALNMGDGTSDFTSSDNYQEDHVIYDGKYIKLDQIRMKYNYDNFMDTHLFNTIIEQKVYPDRSCDIKFEPICIAKDGLDLIFWGITQYLTYGYYTGECNIGGEKIVIPSSLGIVEHVRARW